MASFDTTADATDSLYARNPQSRLLLDPHQLTLGSVAESFRQEEYEPAPHGVDQEEWRRLVRRERNHGNSLLDERSGPAGSNTSTDQSYSYAQQPQPSTSNQSRSEVQNYDSSLYSTSNSHSQSHSHSHSHSQEQEHSHSTEQSDRTELLSQRLAGDGDQTRETLDETRDSASSFLGRVQGGGGKGKDPTTRGGNLGNGQNMTLREQEKVRLLISFPLCLNSGLELTSSSALRIGHR